MDFELTPGQQLAVDQLGAVAARSGGALELTSALSHVGTGPEARVEISVDCSGIASAPSGVRLRARERFVLAIDPVFPFSVPVVCVPHTRWAGVPHVQWGRQLCLYAAPSVEWVPADGMRGLIDRLATWLRRAAVGELDPDDQPLHPPVAYASAAAGIVLVDVDLPPTGASTTGPTVVVAVCRQGDDRRVDVVEWVTPAQWQTRFQTSEISGGLHDDGRRLLAGVAVLLERDIGFEYPDGGGALMRGLRDAGAPVDLLAAQLSRVAQVNERLDGAHAQEGLELPARPLHLLIGTPSRRVQADGPRLTHLVAWRFDEEGRRLLAGRAQADGQQGPPAVEPWLRAAAITWVPVLERRPEVTQRRDADSASAWLSGKRVLILGCGALGAPAAEICVRADASEITVADNALVTPGILVRQPYADDDIGSYKASALARRLNGIHHGERVAPLVGNVIPMLLNDGFTPSKYDLIIDATADAAVASRLEERRSALAGLWPPVLSLLIGHDARRGLLAYARPDASGGGRDILRKLGIAAHGARSLQLADVAEDFFPATARHRLFQPEPGCSAPTFAGSAAEVGALAAHLMTAGLDALAGRAANQPLAAAVVRLEPGCAGTEWIAFPADVLVPDEDSGYQVRISPAALREMRAESVRGARVRGRGIETGGMLIGEIDDACRCVWIDASTPPPPDSTLSPHRFEHGLQGVGDLLDYHRRRSGELSCFVGMWHIHPDHAPHPSPTDTNGMHTLVGRDILDAPRAVLLILGGSPQQWSAWLETGETPPIYARLVDTPAALNAPSLAPSPGDLPGGVWPGGYLTRAVAPPRRGSRLRRWRLRLLPVRRAGRRTGARP